MAVKMLLDRLDAVRRAGRGWRARCPCCGGRRRDHLSITEADDGRILLHAFCGCSALEVVQSVGLRLADLFPERLPPESAQDRKAAWLAARESGWRAALRLLDEEAFIVGRAAEHVVLTEAPMSSQDMARLNLACSRIEQARTMLADSWRSRS